MHKPPIIGRSSRYVKGLAFGKTPISCKSGAKYLAAFEALSRVIKEGHGLSQDAIFASEVKGMYNRVLRQDQNDWEAVRTLVGAPDRAMCNLVAKWLLKLRDLLRNGEALDEHLRGPLARKLQFTLFRAATALRRAQFDIELLTVGS
jgi:hypothetical protein